MKHFMINYNIIWRKNIQYRKECVRIQSKYKDIIKDLQNLNKKIDFRNLNKDHELFSKENEKVVGNFKIETPKNVFTDKFIYSGSKTDSFKSESDSISKLGGISKCQTKEKLILEKIITAYLEVILKKKVLILL